jgi:hypothetical protein
MNTQSIRDVLAQVDVNMSVASASLRLAEGIRCLQAKEYLFVEYDSVPHKQEFYYGINIHFTDNLRKLIRKKPVVYTTDRHDKSHILHSEKPVPVHNTGPAKLQIGQRFTVVPPMCLVPEAIRVDGEYVLQTVDLEKFSREFRQLVIWLNLMHDIDETVGLPALRHSKEYWRRIFKMADAALCGNSLWSDLIRAVCQYRHTNNMSDACRCIAEVTGRHWRSGFVPDSATDHYRNTVLTGRQTLEDFRAGLEAANAVATDATVFSAFNDEEAAEGSPAVKALDALVTSQLNVYETLDQLTTLSESLKLSAVGVVSKATALFVKPMETMDVLLCVWS